MRVGDKSGVDSTLKAYPWVSERPPSLPNDGCSFGIEKAMRLAENVFVVASVFLDGYPTEMVSERPEEVAAAT